jgi:hypothetical protein
MRIVRPSDSINEEMPFGIRLLFDTLRMIGAENAPNPMPSRIRVLLRVARNLVGGILHSPAVGIGELESH